MVKGFFRGMGDLFNVTLFGILPFIFLIAAGKEFSGRGLSYDTYASAAALLAVSMVANSVMINKFMEISKKYGLGFAECVFSLRKSFREFLQEREATISAAKVDELKVAYDQDKEKTIKRIRTMSKDELPTMSYLQKKSTSEYYSPVICLLYQRYLQTKII